MPFLKDHIRKAWISVDAGEEVKVVGDHGDVKIVEAGTGQRFSVREELLSESAVTDVPLKPPADRGNAFRTGKRSRRAAIFENASTLFDHGKV